jgi:cobalamin synthase
VLTGRVSGLATAATVAVGVAVAVLLAGLDGALLVAAAAVTVICLGFVYRRWLGGATGDGLGAATELSETVVLVIAAGLA